MRFLHQQNPEAGNVYGHFNLLIENIGDSNKVDSPGQHDDHSLSSNVQKVVIIDKVPKGGMITTAANVKAFFERCKTQSLHQPKKLEANTAVQQVAMPMDTTKANIKLFFEKYSNKASPETLQPAGNTPEQAHIHEIHAEATTESIAEPPDLPPVPPPSQDTPSIEPQHVDEPPPFDQQHAQASIPSTPDSLDHEHQTNQNGSTTQQPAENTPEQAHITETHAEATTESIAEPQDLPTVLSPSQDPSGSSPLPDSSLCTLTSKSTESFPSEDATSDPAQDEKYQKLQAIVARIANFKRTRSDSESEDDKSSIDDLHLSEPEEHLATAANHVEQQNDKENTHPEMQAVEPKPTKQQNSDSTHEDDDDGDTVCVIRLARHDVKKVFQDLSTFHEVLMHWSNKKLIGKTVCISQWKTSEVVGRCEIQGQQKISSFSDLRNCQCFQDANRDVRNLWKHRLLKEEKQLYVWKIKGMEQFEKPKKVLGHEKERCFSTSLQKLTSFQYQPLPEMNLEATTEHFIQMLSEQDKHHLECTMKSLDNCFIRVGTTCSGTDIAVSVVKDTFKALSKHFGAAWRL